MADEHRMGEFWDERAREDAMFFVDDRMPYGRPDERRFWAGGTEALDTILDQLGASLHGHEHVVEVGCGLGRITRALASRAARVTALDASAEMLHRAGELNPGLESVTWVHGNGADLRPVADGDADACFSHVVFQHIPDPAITLGYVREMGRVLRPGGWAAFQVSNAPEVHRPRGSRIRLGRRPRGTRDPRWLGSAVEIHDVESAATEGGCVVQRVANAGTQYCLVLLRRT